MPCEHYKDALTEIAATAAEPEGQLRAHLDTCASCRATLAAEQSLFSAIDTGLYAAANTEVPATLLPRVRVRLNEESSPSRSWVNARVLLACAATLAFVFLMTQIHWRSTAVQPPVNTAANKVPEPSVTSPSQKQNIIPALPVKEHSFAHSQVATVKNHVPHDSSTSRDLDPEVLVPRDQEILLASYQQRWQSRKRAPLAAAGVEVAGLTPLEIAPIQIAELDVKLMAEQQQRFPQ